MAGNLVSYLLLAVWLCLHVSNVSAKEEPLQVSIKEIGIDHVVFEVKGSDTLNNLPVTSIVANYTQVSYNSHNIFTSGKHLLKNSTFQVQVKISNLNAGAKYNFKFYAINTKNQRGEESEPIQVLLRPETPNFSIKHSGQNSLKFFWDYQDEKEEDYFLLSVEKESAIGCGLTLNFTRCYGKSYDFSEIMVGETYIFKFTSHNPSGFSDTVVVRFPYE